MGHVENEAVDWDAKLAEETDAFPHVDQGDLLRGGDNDGSCLGEGGGGGSFVHLSSRERSMSG